MKLSQRLGLLASSLVMPEKMFEPGQIVVTKSIFMEPGSEPWERLMVVMPPEQRQHRQEFPEPEYVTRERAYGIMPAVSAHGVYNVLVAFYHHMADDYDLTTVDARKIRLATDVEIKRGDALAYERALEYQKTCREATISGNTARLLKKDDEVPTARVPLDESTWAGGGITLCGNNSYGERQFQSRNDCGLKDWTRDNTRTDAVMSAKDLSDKHMLGTKNITITTPVLSEHAFHDTSEQNGGSGGDVDWVGFNGAFGEAQDVAEELIVVQQYARLLLKTNPTRFPVHYEGGRLLGVSLTIVHNPAHADETYVVINRNHNLDVTASWLSAESSADRLVIADTTNVDSVVAIDVKNYRVISVAVYLK